MASSVKQLAAASASHAAHDAATRFNNDSNSPRSAISRGYNTLSTLREIQRALLDLAPANTGSNPSGHVVR